MTEYTELTDEDWKWIKNHLLNCPQLCKEIKRLSEENESLTAENRKLKEAQRWIPVEEKLPEIKKAVLVYAPINKNIFEAYLGEQGIWHFFGGGLPTINDVVTHWRPLPAPPQKGE